MAFIKSSVQITSSKFNNVEVILVDVQFIVCSANEYGNQVLRLREKNIITEKAPPAYFQTLSTIFLTSAHDVLPQDEFSLT